MSASGDDQSIGDEGHDPSDDNNDNDTNPLVGNDGGGGDHSDIGNVDNSDPSGDSGRGGHNSPDDSGLPNDPPDTGRVVDILPPNPLGTIEDNIKALDTTG